MSTDQKTLFAILEQAYEQQVSMQFKNNCDSNQRLDQNLFRKFINNKTSGVTDQQINELFKMFDRNRSGTINIDEFSAVFKQIKYLKPDEVQKMQSPQNNYPGNNQNQYAPMYNVTQKINPNTNQRDINLDIFVKDINQTQDQLTGANQGFHQMQNQYVPNPMLDNPYQNSPAHQSPYGQQNNNLQFGTGSPYNQQQNQQGDQNSPYRNQNQPQGKYPQLSGFSQQGQQQNIGNNFSNQQQDNSQNKQKYPNLNQTGQNQQQNMITQLNGQNNPPNFNQPGQHQQQNMITQLTGQNNHPNFNQPGSNQQQNIITQLTGQNNNPNSNQQGQNRQNDIVQQLTGKDNQLEVNAMAAKALVTNEDPFETLLVKLGVLKKQHQQKQIDLFSIKKVYSGKSISFKDLMKFLKDYGLQLNKNEENVLKESLTDKNGETVYIKEFLEFMSLKDTYQEKPLYPNVIPPQQQNNQSPSNKQNNNIPINPPQPQIKPNVRENEVIAQLMNNTLVIPGQNNNIAQNVQYNGHNVKVDPNIVDILRTSIQTRNFYEREDENLKGYHQFIKVFKELQLSGKQFTDQAFSPNADSIIDDVQARKYNEWRQLQWQRPSQIFGKKDYQMFMKIESMQTSRIGLGKLISPYDIQQGMLGDCYFLSSVSSLAQEPQRILNLFVTRIKNQYGIYCVKICYDGEWTVVYVDDHFPCKYDKPAFTKSCDNELWVLILEKAWAKLFRNYYNIEAGYCREALRDLTGAPTKTIQVMEEEEVDGKMIKRVNDSLGIILKEALSKEHKYVITAGAEDEENLTKSTADRLGLVNSHAYSIIGVKDITHPKLGNVTLLRLRNPWGKLEWKGDWSDNSNLWTPELKEKFRICNKDDGIFYMSLKDFQRYFDDVCVCYYHDNFQYNSIRVNNSNPKKSQYISMRVFEEGTYYVSLLQPNKRNFRESQKYKYSGSRLFITQISTQTGQKQTQFIGASQKRDREVFGEFNLKPGNYLIQSKVFWESNLASSYVVSTYGVQKTQLQLVPKNQVPPYLEECLLQKARKSTKLKPLKNHDNIQKCNYLESKEGIGFYYIKNSSNKTLDMEVNFQGSNNIKVRRPFRVESKPIKCVVPPNTEYIIPLTVSFKGYSFKCSESYTVS